MSVGFDGASVTQVAQRHDVTPSKSMLGAMT